MDAMVDEATLNINGNQMQQTLSLSLWHLRKSMHNFCVTIMIIFQVYQKSLDIYGEIFYLVFCNENSYRAT